MMAPLVSAFRGSRERDSLVGMLLHPKPLYAGIELRHRILLEYDKLFRALPTKTIYEGDTAISAQQLADRIGVPLLDIQRQVDYLLTTNELQHFAEVPIVHPLRYTLTIPGAAAIADDKYPSMVRRLRNEVLDARWRTITGWLAALALVLSILQWRESNSLENRVQMLEQKSEQ